MRGGVDASEVAEVVFRLVDKSLLNYAPGPAGVRCSMLQTFADYVREREPPEASGWTLAWAGMLGAVNPQVRGIAALSDGISTTRVGLAVAQSTSAWPAGQNDRKSQPRHQRPGVGPKRASAMASRVDPRRARTPATVEASQSVETTTGGPSVRR